MAFPANPTDNQTFTLDGRDYTYRAASDVWELMGGDVPIGTVIDFAGKNLPKGWQLCDGSPAQTDALSLVLGGGTGTSRAAVPDLRNMFVRGANTMANVDPATQHQDTTRRPRNPFVTDNSGNHDHDYWDGINSGGQGIRHADHGAGEFYIAPSQAPTWPGGAHTHRITGGGDPETAPKHVILAKIIKV